MGTRSGDLDPGVPLYLLQARGLDAAALSRLVNKEAGLLGVSGSSGDMQDLLGREATDPAAAEAIALFCYQARKFLGALAAALGGLDTLVFTARRPCASGSARAWGFSASSWTPRATRSTCPSSPPTPAGWWSASCRPTRTG
jgi:acetate kinase